MKKPPPLLEAVARADTKLALTTLHHESQNATMKVKRRSSRETSSFGAGLVFTWAEAESQLLTLIPDATHPHLYRIKHPDGWTSSPANLTRARDAAYGHARYLLGAETPAEASYSPEVEVEAGREAA